MKNMKQNNNILKILIGGNHFSVSEICEKLEEKIPLPTLKRYISKMVIDNLLIKSGKGRSVKYQISNTGRINFRIDPHEYCMQEIDKRAGLEQYNFSLIEDLNNIFLENELIELQNATNEYTQKIKDISNVTHQKELERFIIELSWKSSRIEGNTYTLLDTEKLLKEGIEAVGKTKDEAIMIINHKNAFDFIYQNKNLFKEVSVSKIEEIHKILIKDLRVENNLRLSPVGILGSKYLPLDNQFQIREALEKLCKTIQYQKDPYSKALLMILGISYIQPFEDGNKRTSRLLGNAVLLAYGLAPLSYRAVDEEFYRESIMVFYELNSIIPFKSIFIDQYVFSTKNYLL
jgi:prophage maintenance system killer protein